MDRPPEQHEPNDESRTDSADQAAAGPSREVLRALGALPAAHLESEPPRLPRLALLGAALSLIVTWAALVLWGLGDIPFHTKGEPREALVVWEMTHGGSWILPRRNGTELPSKPPLFHWLGAVTSNLHGATNEWSTRFPSALTALLGGLMVLVAGARLWSVRAGLFAALVLLTSFDWLRYATAARVDMVLTVSLTMAFLSLLFFLRSRDRRWLIPLYIGIALSVLGKGPVGIALPGLVALVVCAVSRDITPLQQMRLLAGAAAVALLGGSWYLLAYLEGGYDFFYKQVLDENVFRFLGSDDLSGGHRHPLWRLYLLLLGGLLPWSLVLPAVAVRLWRRRTELSAQDGAGYLLVWFFAVLAFFSIPASKRSVYLLGLYPAVALLVGHWLDTTLRDREPTPWLRRMLLPAAPLATLLAIVIGLAAIAMILGLPVDAWLAGILKPRDVASLTSVAEVFRDNAPILLGCIGIMGLGALGLVACLRAPNPLAVATCLFILSAGSTVAIRHGVLLGIAEADTQRDLMRAVRSVVEPDHAVFFHGTFNYGAVYYSHGHIPVYDGPWPGGGPRYVLKAQRDWARERANAIHHYASVRDADGARVESTRLILLRRVVPSQD